MSSSVYIELRNDISEISRVIDKLEEFGSENKIPGKIITEFALAVDEIITNIISYGYDDNEEHTISVVVFTDDENLTAIVEDEAKQFNPLEVPEADISKTIEERKVGGLGIYLVRKLMDSVEYEYNCGKNIFKIKKKFN
jgi:serine/threonine-protein kinase RsbW